MFHPAAWAAVAMMWAGYGLTVHTFGFARGTGFYVAGGVAAVWLGSVWARRSEAKRRADQDVDRLIAEDRVIAEMELLWDSPENH